MSTFDWDLRQKTRDTLNKINPAWWQSNTSILQQPGNHSVIQQLKPSLIGLVDLQQIPDSSGTANQAITAHQVLESAFQQLANTSYIGITLGFLLSVLSVLLIKVYAAEARNRAGIYILLGGILPASILLGGAINAIFIPALDVNEFFLNTTFIAIQIFGFALAISSIIQTAKNSAIKLSIFSWVCLFILLYLILSMQWYALNVNTDIGWYFLLGSFVFTSCVVYVVHRKSTILFTSSMLIGLFIAVGYLYQSQGFFIQVLATMPLLILAWMTTCIVLPAILLGWRWLLAKKIAKSSICPTCYTRSFKNIIGLPLLARWSGRLLAKEEPQRQKRFVDYFVCDHCHKSAKIEHVTQLTGVIGGISGLQPIQTFPHCYEINLWDEANQRARNADVDHIIVRAGNLSHYELALNSVINILKGDATRPAKWCKRIPVEVEDSVSLPAGIVTMLKDSFKNVKMIPKPNNTSWQSNVRTYAEK